MLEEVRRKIRDREELTLAEKIFVYVAGDYAPVKGLLRVEALGPRARKNSSYYFEVRKSSGLIHVQTSFTMDQWNTAEILENLCQAVKQLHLGATSAREMRMRMQERAQ